MKKGRSIIGTAVLVSTAGFILTAPSLLSTNWGRESAVGIINRWIPGQVAVQNWSFGWTGGQEVQGFKLSDPQGREVAAVDKISTEASLFALLTGSKQVGLTKIEKPELHIVEAQSGETNLDQALGSDSSDSDESGSGETQQIGIQVPFTGELELTAGKITLEREGEPTVVITDMEGRFESKELGAPLTGRISGKTEQGGVRGEFEVDSVVEGFDRKGRLEFVLGSDGIPQLSSNAKVNVNMRATSLPVAALDQVVDICGARCRGLLGLALGDKIDVRADNRLDAEGLTINTQLSSPNLKASLQGQTRDGLFQLSQPGSAQLTISPAFIQQLSRIGEIPEGVSLTRPVNATLNITTLALPVQGKDRALDFRKLKADISLAIQNADFSAPQPIGAFSIRNTEGRLSIVDLLQQGLEFTLNSEVMQNGLSSRVSIDTKSSNLLNKKGVLDPSGMHTDIHVEGIEVPTALADRFTGLDGMLPDWVGPRVNVKVDAVRRSGQASADLSLTADNAKIDRLHFEQGDRVVVSSDQPMQFKVPARILSQMMPADQAVTVHNDIPLTVELREFSVPAVVDRLPMPKELKIDMTTRLGQYEVSGLQNLGRIRVDSTEISLAGSMDNAKLRQELKATQLDPNNSVTVALGPEIRSTTDATLRLDDEGMADLRGIKGRVVTTHSQFDLEADVLGMDEIHLTKAAKLQYRAQPEVIKKLTAGQPGLPSLEEPANAVLSIQPLSIRLLDFDPNQLALKGTLEVDRLAVRDQGRNLSAAMDDLNVNWDVDFPKGTLTTKLSAQTQAGPNRSAGSLKGDLTVSNWRREGLTDFGDARIRGDLDMRTFPVAIAATLSGYPQLSTLIGDLLDLKVDADLSGVQKPTGSFALDATGEDFSANANLTLGKTLSLQGSKPARVSWLMTPARFTAARQLMGVTGHTLQLIQPSRVNFEVRSLQIPLNGALAQELSKTDIDVTVDKLYIRDPENQQSVKLDNLKAKLKAADLRQLLEFDLKGSGNVEQQGRSSRNMDIDVNGSVEDLVSNGELNWTGLGTDSDITLKHVPAALLTDFLGFGSEVREQVDAVFGDDLNVDGRLRYQKGNGAVAARLSSATSTANIDAKIRNHMLTLNEPIEAQIEVTEKVSKTLLKNFNPLMSEAVAAERPIQFRVERDGVQIPIDRYDPSRLQVGQATIDVGKLTVRNGGTMALIVGIAEGGGLFSLKSRGNMRAWFTPQYVSIRNGVVKVERMDAMLSDSLHVCSWGTVDIPKNKLDMVFGIPADTMKANFNASNLPDDYVFQEPITGTIDNPKINKGRAVARLAAMKLGKQGGGGDIFGTIIGVVGSGGKDGPAPAPTTQPFPWPPLEEKAVTETKNDSPFSPEPKDPDPQPKKPKVEDIFKGLFK